MNYKVTAITNNLDSIIGEKIVNIFRLVIEDEYLSLPELIRDESSDGQTYIVLSNGIVLAFYPNTELFTIDCEIISEREIPKEAFSFVHNHFWANRKNQTVLGIDFQYNQRKEPFSITFNLSNGEEFHLSYVSENEYVFDSLIIESSTPNSQKV